MKKIYLLLFPLLMIILGAGNLNAQVSNYSFSSAPGTFTPITGTLVAAATNALPSGTPESATMDDNTFDAVAIPFPVTVRGISYTSFNANTNGWISFGTATGTGATTTPISTSNTYDNVISASSFDLMGIFASSATRTSGSDILTAVGNTTFAKVGAPIQGTGIPAGTTILAFDATTITMSAAATASSTGTYVSWATGEIRTDVVGAAPNRTFIIQYTGFSVYATTLSATTNNTSFSFQIRLNETSGVIQVVYGTYYRAGGSSTAQVGLRGAATSDYNNRSTTTDWSATTAGSSNAATVTWSNTVFPAAGLTYTWTPPAPCTGTPEAGSITAPLVRPTCGATAPSPATAVITGFTTGVSNITIQWETSTDNATWVNAAGTGNATATYTLPNHTAGQTEYYRAKVTCTSSGLFDVSDVLQIVDPSVPSTQSSAIVIPNIGINSATISWTNGNGPRRYAVINTTNTFTDPVNGSGAALTANAVYSGSGEQIIYDGTGSSVTVTGLTCGTQYYVRIYEYYRCNASAPYNYFYNVATATGNPLSFTESPVISLPACIDFIGFTGTNLNTLFPNWYEAATATPTGSTSAWTGTTVGTATTAKINLFTNTRQEWIIGPRVLATASTALEFDAAITDFGSASVDAEGMTGTDDKVMVKVSTDCGVTWTTLYTFDASNTEPLRASAALTPQSINLSAYAGQNIIIAFHATDGPLNDAPDYDFHIDNVCIRNIPADLMDWVNLQWPPTASVSGGNSTTVYTRGYEPGVTEAAGAGAGITVWVGISPAGAPASSNPNTWTTWIPAVFNVQSGNDDEFMAAIGNTLAAGTYQYASRWQLNGGNYRYGGYNAGGGGFWDGTTNVSGVLTVTAANNDECGGAIAITGTQTAGSNFGSSQSMAANASCTSTSSPDVWYTFTATSSGAAIIALTNVVTIDPILEAFTGTCGTLTSLGCVDAGAAGINETQTLNGLTAGQVVYVRVSGWNGSFGSFNIAVSGGALPVTIEYFTGTKQAGQNRLDWKINCYNSPTVTMTLQRSANGRTYSDLVTLTETSARCQAPFVQNDLNPLPGINYYRLKTIDIDGKIAYSNVVALLGSQKGFEIVSLAPNPVIDRATLSITSAEKSIMEIVVSDVNGKLLSKQRVSLVAGNNQIQLNLKNMAAGTYQVSGLTADGKLKTLRFIKE